MTLLELPCQAHDAGQDSLIVVPGQQLDSPQVLLGTRAIASPCNWLIRPLSCSGLIRAKSVEESFVIVPVHVSKWDGDGDMM